MKLNARTDVSAPADKVFRHLTDFERLEGVARERGADVERVDAGTTPSEAHWRAEFPFRGRTRHTEGRVTSFEVDQQLAIKGESEGLTARMKVELVELAPNQTRVHTSIDLSPGTMKARLLVQSLKLARRSLERRLERRLKQFGRQIEQA